MFLVNLQFCHTIWSCGLLYPLQFYTITACCAHRCFVEICNWSPPTWHTQHEHVYFLYKMRLETFDFNKPLRSFLVWCAIRSLRVIVFHVFGLKKKRSKNFSNRSLKGIMHTHYASGRGRIGFFHCVLVFPLFPIWNPNKCNYSI